MSGETAIIQMESNEIFKPNIIAYSTKFIQQTIDIALGLYIYFYL